MRNAAIEKFSAPPPPVEAGLPKPSDACDEANDQEAEEEEVLEEDAEMLGDGEDVD